MTQYYGLRPVFASGIYGLRPLFIKWPNASIIRIMEKKPQQSESRDADKYVVRLPEGMRDRIAALAKSNNRSMNAEIVARLQRTFSEDIVENVTSHPQFMKKFMGRIEELIAEHGIEYVFPEENHEGKKRRPLRPAPGIDLPDQAGDMPAKPPKRRVNLKR